MIAPTREGLDSVINFSTLKPDDPRIPWWWCDALFMALPVWARMYAATGEHKYIDYLDAQWQRTSDLLYDKDEHLYARDATYISKRGPNGKKIFWSRGEGWAMGGIVRTLQFLPKDDPRRPLYVQQLREMSVRVAELQGPDGLWHSSLLDPEHFPLPELSGSTLFVYGIAWGVNEGVLDRAKYMPVIERAWRGILQHVYADGRLGDIQQTGAEPTPYLPSSSYTYGVGGYLLAGSELKRIAAAGQVMAPHPDAAATTDPGLYAQLNLPQAANPRLRDLILVGDSTVRNGKGDGAHNQMGWGDELAPYFNLSRINIVNRAMGGRSSRTYITEGHWAETMKLIKPGDVVLIQFGHNDSGPYDDPARARGSIPGVGEDTVEIENPIQKRHETVHTFGWYLDRYVRDTRAKGATPILCSLVPRKTWKNGKIERQTDTYRGWTEQIAEGGGSTERVGIDVPGLELAVSIDQPRVAGVVRVEVHFAGARVGRLGAPTVPDNKRSAAGKPIDRRDLPTTRECAHGEVIAADFALAERELPDAVGSEVMRHIRDGEGALNAVLVERLRGSRYGARRQIEARAERSIVANVARPGVMMV